MFSHIFYFAFLSLHLHAAILFFKKVSAEYSVKALNGGNSSLTYLDINNDLHLNGFVDEGIEHSLTETLGFEGKTIKNIYKKSDQYPNDYYIVWGEKNASFLQFQGNTLKSRYNQYVNDSSIVGCDTGTNPGKYQYTMS